MKSGYGGTSTTTCRKGQPQETPVQNDSRTDSTYDLPQILTVEETAEFLRLNVKTVHAAIAAGTFPGRKVGRRTVILRDALLDWLKSEERVLPGRRRKR